MAANSKTKKDERPIVNGRDFSATGVEAVDIAAANGAMVKYDVAPDACGGISEPGRRGPILASNPTA